MGNIVLYGNAMGFPISERDAPKGIYRKAQKMIAGLDFSSSGDSERITSIELIIDIDRNFEKCIYQLAVYSCAEDEDLQQADYDIEPETELYREFKEYALKILTEKLFPI